LAKRRSAGGVRGAKLNAARGATNVKRCRRGGAGGEKDPTAPRNYGELPNQSQERCKGERSEEIAPRKEATPIGLARGQGPVTAK